MIKEYKIFCDESNHLSSDKSNLMVIGAISVNSEKVEYINRYIKYLKHKHNAKNELKWTKLNNNKKDFYQELLEFFFLSRDLKFNAQIVLNKSILNHKQYNDNEADNFYYKMYYYTLLPFLEPKNQYNIFIDYKDTKGGERVKKLNEIIKNSFYGNIDTQFTIIHSHESQIMQLTDLLIGAISYKNRQDIAHLSEIKRFIIRMIEKFSGLSLDTSTPQWEEKFRLFRFYPRSF